MTGIGDTSAQAGMITSFCPIATWARFWASTSVGRNELGHDRAHHHLRAVGTQEEYFTICLAWPYRPNVAIITR
jgi:hypothetical protein